MAMFVESFDSYAGIVANTGILSRWFDTGTAISSARQAMVTGRFGVGQAFSAGAGSGSTIHQTNCLLADATGSLFSVTDFAMHVALAVKSVTATGTECGFCLSNSANALQLGLQWVAGSWRLVRWGGVAGGSPAAVLYTSPAIYNNLDFRSFSLKGTIHASTGSCDLRIDGVQVYSATGINTGTGTIDRVGFAQGNTDAGAGVIADDLVVVNSKAAYLPDLRIDPYNPDSDGVTLNLTPSTGTVHYAMVDEPQVSTADWLSGSVVGDRDLLGLPNMVVNPTSILGVNLVGFAAKTDVATRAINLGLDSGGTVSNGSNLNLAAATGYFHRVLELDPNTAAAWTQSGVNGAQLQPRVAV